MLQWFRSSVGQQLRNCEALNKEDTYERFLFCCPGCSFVLSEEVTIETLLPREAFATLVWRREFVASYVHAMRCRNSACQYQYKRAKELLTYYRHVPDVLIERIAELNTESATPSK